MKDGHDTDTNASFTIESGNAKFSADGNIIDGTGEATVTLTWNDNPRTAGVAVRRITIGKTTWTQSGRSGNETHTISLGGGTANIGEDMTAGVKLRTKGERVLLNSLLCVPAIQVIFALGKTCLNDLMKGNLIKPSPTKSKPT